MRETFSSLTEPKISDLPAQRLKYRQETIDVSAFVNVKTKIYYDLRHMTLFFNFGGPNVSKELPGRFNKKFHSSAAAYSKSSNE